MIKKVNNQESIDKNKKGRADGRDKREKRKVLFSLWFIEKLLFIFNFLTKQFYTLYSHLSLHTYCSFRYVLRGRFGFTLAEALIITVMTGFCLLPILGTMQNAQQRTETYDHQSKMQMYSRSRLNAEIANGAFDHNGINLEDEYHYVVYFASGTGSLDEEDANFIELPKTNVPPDKLIQINDSTYLSSDDDYKNEIKRILEIPESSSLNYYLQIVHAYKTSVEIKDRPRLAEFGKTEKDDAGNDKEVSFPSPKSLLGIVVRTSLLESNGDNYNEDNGYLKTGTEVGTATATDDISVQVPPVTLFSFVNLPITTEESIWVADAYSKKIYGVDPISRSLAITINLPTTYTFPNTNIKDNTKAHFEPWCLAITPNQKILAYQTSHYLNFVNIDAKSSNYRKTKVVEIASAPAVLGTGGMAFRPDGEELFVFYKEGNTCYVRPYKVSYELNKGVLKWNNAKTETPKVVGEDVKVDISTTTIVDMVAANDGYLYLGKNNGNKSEILRFPMYQNEFDSNWKQEIFAIATGTIKSLDVSPDGTKLVSIVYDSAKAATSKSYLMKIYDTRDGRQLNQDTEEISLTNFSKPYKAIFTTISSTTYNLDNPYNTDLSDIGNKRNLNVFVTNEISSAGITLDDITPGVTDAANRITNSFSASDSAILKSVLVKDSQNSITGGKVVVAPDNSSVIINDKIRPVLYFSNTDVFNNSNYEVVSELENSALPYGSGKTDSNGRNCTDLVAGKRDILAFTHDKEVEFYNLNTFTQPDVGSYTATSTITSLAMNPQGDMLLTACHKGTSTFYSIFNLWDNNPKNKIYGAANEKVVFDDSTPNMAFALDSKSSNPIFSFFPSSRAFWNVASDSYGYLWDSPIGDAYNRQSFNLDTDWIRRDLIAMPRGGALALYGKDDGSSMLEWIGRRTWKDDPDHGKYKLFARWTNLFNFAPECTIPNQTLADFTYSSVDGWMGRIHVLKNEGFPVSSCIDSIKAAKAGTWTDDETRYITPLIVEFISDTDFKIRDYAIESIGFMSGESRENIEITWKNRGRIKNSRYRLGFWNGKISGSSPGPTVGALRYTYSDSIRHYYSDYYEKGGEKESGGQIELSTLLDGSKEYTQYTVPLDNTKIRNYSITFHSAEIKNYGFPPLGARKLAISPDQGTLAILATDTSNAPILNLFDFNKNIYGPETQLEGMLVDYREPLSNHSYITEFKTIPSYPFPEETGDSLFQKVGSDFRLNGLSSNKIASFPSLTTKFGPYWSSFKDYPANIWANGYSGSYTNYNKRFLGYIRPEYDANKIQARFSEDMRLFYNNNMIFGVIYDNGGNVATTPPSINCDAFNTSLLQIDQSIDSSTSGSFSLATFLSKDKTDPIEFIKDDANPDVDKYLSGNNDWEPLTSTQTYILKNQPTFMGSFIAKSSPNDITLSIDDSRMIYSSDKAKPVLYIGGSKYLWALYKKDFVTNLVRTTNDDGVITSNITLSTDGQKLLMAKDIGTASHTIQMLNISNPDNNLFATNNSEVSRGATKDAYLGEITKLVATDTISCLATKPHTSFNSAKIGGDYKEITNPILSPENLESTWDCSLATNGSMTVASGGIYIYENSSDLLCYNPISNIITKLSNVLKTSSPGSPMTSYDDVLYIFGNEGSGGNPNSGQVQSYDVNTNKAMVSLVSTTVDEPITNFTDEYQVNMALKDADSSKSNFQSPDSIDNFITENKTANDQKDMDYVKPEARYVFLFNSDYHWRNQIAGSLISGSRIGYKNTKEITVNKVMVSNYNRKDLDNGVKEFDIKCSNDGSSWTTILSDKVINKPDRDDASHSKMASFPFGNDYSYKYFALFPSDNYEVLSNAFCVNLIQFWRTGVKRLTPNLGSLTGGNSNDNPFTETNSRGENITIQLSSFPTDYSLRDTYLGGKGNDDYNNPSNAYKANNLVSDTEGWEPTDKYPWIKVSLDKEQKVCAIRFANTYKPSDTRQDIAGIWFYGSNDNNPESPDGNSENPSGSKWEKINFSDDTDYFASPKVFFTFITAEVKPTKPYKHYLVIIKKHNQGHQIRIGGFELYSSPAEITITSITDDYLTPLQTDDLDEVKIGRGACCSTPYGLVYTGGLDGTNATKTALLYWPHAVNKYDGNYYQYGICRSLPNMNNNRANHALVWHKGKIYAIGGCYQNNGNTSENSLGGFIECLDYNTSMSWQPISVADFKFVGEAKIDELFNRHSFGACSFRDEIFVFGGKFNGSHARRSGFAWNPETGIVRKLNYLPKIGSDSGRTDNIPLAPCAAVPFGSKIYIYGYDFEAPTGSGGGPRYRMFEYTP